LSGIGLRDFTGAIKPRVGSFARRPGGPARAIVKKGFWRAIRMTFSAPHIECRQRQRTGVQSWEKGRMSAYLGELRSEWRALSSATIGLASGLVINAYVISIMGPYLLAEFGWSKSQFALLGALGLLSILAFPFVGRLADRFGVRKTAVIGVVASPLLFLAFSRTDDIRFYAVVYGVQCFLLTTTTPPVYSRIVVQYFERARGLALALAACGPGLIVAVGGPLLNNHVAEHGWRSGYVALVVFTALVGLSALALMPAERKTTPVEVRPRTARQDYAIILRSRPFWILLIAMWLCNLPQAVIVAQLAIILSENGVTGKEVSVMISTFATGMLAGRFLTGLALDRFSAPVVAFVGLALSAVGMLVLASPVDTPAVLILAVTLIGLSYGAESDVIAYLIYRSFGVKVYSSVFGLLAATVAIASAAGAGSASFALKMTGEFTHFLTITGALVLAGSAMFLLLPRHVEAAKEEEAPA
jgi:MFS family permease